MPRLPGKTFIQRKQRVDAILPILKQVYPDAKCSLNFKTPLQLLTATILSAQCTDARVNIVTENLFRKYKSAKELAGAPTEELERAIQSAGFFRAKAKSLKAMAQALIDQHQGEVPKTMEDLTLLAGVGRKTANVVLGNAFGIDMGIVVDTHVTRLSQRLGLTRHVDAVKIEQDLIPLVPKKDWTLWPHLMISHGRAICQARKPACRVCALLAHCPTGPALIESGRAREA